MLPDNFFRKYGHLLGFVPFFHKGTQIWLFIYIGKITYDNYPATYEVFFPPSVNIQKRVACICTQILGEMRRLGGAFQMGDIERLKGSTASEHTPH